MKEGEKWSRCRYRGSVLWVEVMLLWSLLPWSVAATSICCCFSCYWCCYCCCSCCYDCFWCCAAVAIVHIDTTVVRVVIAAVVHVVVPAVATLGGRLHTLCAAHQEHHPCLQCLHTWWQFLQMPMNSQLPQNSLFFLKIQIYLSKRCSKWMGRSTSPPPIPQD